MNWVKIMDRWVNADLIAQVRPGAINGRHTMVDISGLEMGIEVKGTKVEDVKAEIDRQLAELYPEYKLDVSVTPTDALFRHETLSVVDGSTFGKPGADPVLPGESRPELIDNISVFRPVPGYKDGDVVTLNWEKGGRLQTHCFRVNVAPPPPEAKHGTVPVEQLAPAEERHSEPEMSVSDLEEAPVLDENGVPIGDKYQGIEDRMGAAKAAVGAGREVHSTVPTPQQRKLLNVHLTRLELDRAHMLSFLTFYFDRPIESRNDLTRADMNRILDMFEHRPNEVPIQTKKWTERMDERGELPF